MTSPGNQNDPVTPLTPDQALSAEERAARENYVQRELADIDILADETAGGPPGITISTRLGDWALNRKGLRGFIGRWGCRALNLVQRNHDANAAAGDQERSLEAQAYIRRTGLIDKK